MHIQIHSNSVWLVVIRAVQERAVSVFVSVMDGMFPQLLVDHFVFVQAEASIHQTELDSQT